MNPRTCKLTILGDSSVGKTTLIHSFVNDEFRADFGSTVGTDLCSKFLTVKGQEIQALIWDTAGTERFHSLGESFFRGTEACILVADLTNRVSFDHLENWRNTMIEAVGIDDTHSFPFAIFANKADKVVARVVSEAEVQEWGRRLDCPVFEVSAKNGVNVETGFKQVLTRFVENSYVVPMLIASPKLEPAEGRQRCC